MRAQPSRFLIKNHPPPVQSHPPQGCIILTAPALPPTSRVHPTDTKCKTNHPEGVSYSPLLHSQPTRGCIPTDIKCKTNHHKCVLYLLLLHSQPPQGCILPTPSAKPPTPSGHLTYSFRTFQYSFVLLCNSIEF